MGRKHLTVHVAQMNVAICIKTEKKTVKNAYMHKIENVNLDKMILKYIFKIGIMYILYGTIILKWRYGR